MVQPYNKVRLSGTMPGGEVWSVNPAFADLDGGAISNYTDLVDWADDIATKKAGNVLGDTLLEILSSSATLNRIRTEYYAPDGKLTEAAELQLVPAVAGTFTANKPFQSAIVASLRSRRPGRSFRGRLYWPALNIGLETPGLRIPAAYTAGVAQDTVSLLLSLASFPIQGLIQYPMIVSQTLGVNTPVTRVEVGNVVDVQRRRRDSLVEQYTSLDVIQT